MTNVKCKKRLRRKRKAEALKNNISMPRPMNLFPDTWYKMFVIAFIGE